MCATSATPIVPVIAGDAPRAMALARELRSEGVYVQAFSYPVVPKGAARVRCILSAAHTQRDINQTLEVTDVAFKAVRDQFGG